MRLIENDFCPYLCLCAIWVTGKLSKEYFAVLQVQLEYNDNKECLKY